MSFHIIPFLGQPVIFIFIFIFLSFFFFAFFICPLSQMDTSAAASSSSSSATTAISAPLPSSVSLAQQELADVARRIAAVEAEIAETKDEVDAKQAVRDGFAFGTPEWSAYNDDLKGLRDELKRLGAREEGLRAEKLQLNTRADALRAEAQQQQGTRNTALATCSAASACPSCV